MTLDHLQRSAAKHRVPLALAALVVAYAAAIDAPREGAIDVAQASYAETLHASRMLQPQAELRRALALELQGLEAESQRVRTTSLAPAPMALWLLGLATSRGLAVRAVETGEDEDGAVTMTIAAAYEPVLGLLDDLSTAGIALRLVQVEVRRDGIDGLIAASITVAPLAELPTPTTVEATRSGPRRGGASG